MSQSPSAEELRLEGEPAPRVRAGRWILAPIAASLVLLGLVGTAIPRLSSTVDELYYVHHGTAFWYHGDLTWLIEKGVQPLPLLIQNLPGAVFLRLKYGGLPDNTSRPGDLDNFARTGMTVADQMRVMNLARFTNLVLSGFGTIFTVWWFTRRWFDDLTAALAVTFCAIEPNLLAGFVVNTGDAPVVPFVLLTLGLYWDHLRNPARRPPWAVALVFGIGFGLKLTALPQGLLAMGACFVTRMASDLWSGRAGFLDTVKASCQFLFKDVATVALLGLLVSWLANGFAMGPVLASDSEGTHTRACLRAFGIEEGEADSLMSRMREWKVPVTVSTSLRQAGHSMGGHPSWFLGKPLQKGPFWYYPYILLMKTHLVILAFAAVGLCRRASWSTPLGLTAVLLILFTCTVKISFGPRYFLSLLALFCVLGGVGLSALMRSASLPRPLRATVCGCAAVASLGLTLNSWPEFFTHTSPLWGGDDRGYLYADANYDWGQGLFQAFRGADRIGLKPVCYFPTCDPYFAVPTDRDVDSFNDEQEMLRRMRGHYAAVSIAQLYHQPSNTPLLSALREPAQADRETEPHVLLLRPEIGERLPGAGKSGGIGPVGATRLVRPLIASGSLIGLGTRSPWVFSVTFSPSRRSCGTPTRSPDSS